MSNAVNHECMNGWSFRQLSRTGRELNRHATGTVFMLQKLDLRAHEPRVAGKLTASAQILYLA